MCTEICLCQLQAGTKTLEQSTETTSLLLNIKTCCKGFHGWFFYFLIPVKRNLDLSCPCATWLTHQLTVLDGVFRNHLKPGEFAKTSTCIPYGQCQATKASTHLQLICTFQFIPTETSQAFRSSHKTLSEL